MYPDLSRALASLSDVFVITKFTESKEPKPPNVPVRVSFPVVVFLQIGSFRLCRVSIFTILFLGYSPLKLISSFLVSI